MVLLCVLLGIILWVALFAIIFLLEIIGIDVVLMAKIVVGYLFIMFCLYPMTGTMNIIKFIFELMHSNYLDNTAMHDSIVMTCEELYYSKYRPVNMQWRDDYGLQLRCKRRTGRGRHRRTYQNLNPKDKVVVDIKLYPGDKQWRLEKIHW